MKLPFDLLSQNYVKPKLYLCETDKAKMCQLETTEMSGSFKFNAYSELTFTIGRTYTNMVTGETLVNPFYNKIEALRLVYLEGFGYFEIQEPEIVTDGIKEVKNVTAYSLEYRLSQRYLENFKINTGEADSLEVIAAGNSGIINPIKLLDNKNPKLSLLDLVLERVYDWKIGYIDDSLTSISRQFEISRASVYDFIVQDICEKFNCFAVFDTINNKINLYAESLISKYIGDGKNNTFIVSPPYKSVDTVSINSYKVSKYNYTYDPQTGYLTLDTIPDEGARIEITDGSQEQWQTDVYVSFDNLVQEANVSYSAEDIKTVLTVKGADDLDIREVNMGLPYIVDLSYYYTIDWMGEDLYKAYTRYLQTSSVSQSQYIENAKKMLEFVGHITYETQRLSLQYSIAENVTSITTGTYYVRGGTHPNYYYTEVQLPDEYNAQVEHYYTLSGTDLNEDKFSKLYSAIQTYFVSGDSKDVTEIEKYKEDFAFVEKYTLEALINELSNATNLEQKTKPILTFFDEVWDQLGRIPLESLYLKAYKTIEETNKDMNWHEESNENYWRYYPVTLVIQSLEKDIEDRKITIEKYQQQYNLLQTENNTIANNTSIYSNFTHEQLVRLSPFLREDEYTDDNFMETDSDTVEILMKTKQELLECGRIELAKLCEPKLEFSMDMANIYALIEFEPIISQFQLGKLINVVIRPDYIKKARLLAVDINFDDFSDFSCEFGELTSLRTPSSIHADLLANALTAGNSVASNQSYWEKGADLATSTDIKIQNGLLSAIDGIYNSDKSVLIDNRGILLRQVLDNGEYSPYQIWLTNNNILVSTDGFNSAQTGIGVFEVDGKELYGVLAKAVLSGYIESSTIVGGTINIGDGAFVVREDGSVVMNGGSTIAGYAKEEDITELRNTATIISDMPPSSANEGQLWLDTSIEPYTLMVFTNGKWKYFSQQDGETIYITRPETYNEGDLWIVGENDLYNSCSIVDEDADLLLEKIWNGWNKYYTKDGKKITTIRYDGYEEVENGDVGDYITQENGDLNYNIYTSYDELPDPAVIYHPSFFDDAGLNLELRNDSITIYGANEEVLAHQDYIKYYGTNNIAIIDPTKVSSELYLIYSNGQLYLLDKVSKNTFFCDTENSGVKYVNGTLLRATESSLIFNYDHWVDISPRETTLQNNISQNFTFNKKTGLTIGQANQKFYVNIKSIGMEICENPNIDASTEDVELDPNRVVLISNNSAEIKNATFDGSKGTTFNNNSTFNQQVNLMGFIFKKEQNGSLSLALDS